MHVGIQWVSDRFPIIIICSSILYNYISRYDGKIQLHILESEGLVTEERESKIFPEAGRTDVISCMALTPDFLIWGTDMGGLNYFYIEDWAVITEFKHITGTRLKY